MPRLLTVQPVADGGGSERALIVMLAQLSKAGWDCHVVVPCPPELLESYERVATVHVVPMDRVTTSGSSSRWVRYAARWPRSVLRIGRLCRGLGVDVVHSNSLHCWYGWAAAALTGRPHVWHAREIVFQSRAALTLERFLTSHFSDTVIAVSSTVASQLDPANVVVFTDEADPEVFDPGRAGRFRSSAGIADTVPLVGSVARIDTWKGFDTLLDAVEPMRARCPGLELVIAGGTVDGKEGYAAALEARARSIGGVHWLGPRDDVPDLMADLDVFVQVSSEPEPFGLVVVEALASGVPVVAGDAGGPLEILGADAVAPSRSPLGALVPPGDPAAIADAVIGLMQGRQPGAAGRSARPRLRRAEPGDIDAVMRRVAAGRPRRLGRAA